MQQVKVIRKVPVNNRPVFEVRTISDNKLQGCFCFEIGSADDDPYNEETNRSKAMELAAKIEKGNEDSEEIIYQSPKN